MPEFCVWRPHGVKVYILATWGSWNGDLVSYRRVATSDAVLFGVDCSVGRIAADLAAILPELVVVTVSISHAIYFVTVHSFLLDMGIFPV
jgi:hypothetical protein